MKKYLKLCLLIVAVTLLIGACARENIPTARPDKIDEALWEQMTAAQKDDVIPVKITLHSFEDDAYISRIKETTGYDPEIYMDGVRFHTEVAAKITDALTAAASNTEALRQAIDEELKGFFAEPERIIEYIDANGDNTPAIINYAIVQARTSFVDAKNATLAKVQLEQSNRFVADHVEKRGCTVEYISRYTPIICVNAKRSDIAYFATLDDVVDIYYNDPTIEFVGA